MDDQHEFMPSETAEHLVPTPPDVSNSASVLPPCSDGRRNRSNAWDHFTLVPGLEKIAKCNYCGKSIKYGNGTTSMRNHTLRCTANPDTDANKKMKSASSSTAGAHVTSSPSCVKFDQEACRNALAKLFAGTELPFQFVENKLFREFLSVLQPRFNVCSRSTLTRDVKALYYTEKAKLKKFLSGNCQRVCLTTDGWTSSQNFSYMCVTAHFVDKNWTLQKKILNFCQVEGHSGEVMAKTVESSLIDWGLTRVLSLTVDNATSNDAGLQHLKRRLNTWNPLVVKGDYIHMRCCAHILNLIVKAGLKEVDDSISRICGAVKYINSSPQRMSRFKTCIDIDKVEYNGIVCTDQEIRWNSTYTMLDVALKHQSTFEELELEDAKFGEDLIAKGKGVPTSYDWEFARAILPFLKIFYEATIRISGSSYVTSNKYMLEAFAIGKSIRRMCGSSDHRISSIAERMKPKYNKYWGVPDNLNMLMLIAVVFDPRHKLGYVNWLISQYFSPIEATNMKEKLESCLKALFEEYNGQDVGSQSDSQEAQLGEDANDDIYSMNQYLKSIERNSNYESELTKYLGEAIESSSSVFDILNWWKINACRFPILSSIAREVLAIPVSTIASESAFSTGGRVLGDYRSSLLPKTVEALVCCQDWLKRSSFSLPSDEYVEIEMALQEDFVCPTTINLDD